MNKPTDSYHCISGENAPENIADASPAQLAYLALNGTYGERLVAISLLESIANPSVTPVDLLEAATKDCDHKFVDSNHCLKCGWIPANPNADVVQPFPKGRWT